MKNILVAGGDGFLGWPLSLDLASSGHNVIIADNFMRRTIDMELGAESIIPIASIQNRLKAAKEVLGLNIKFEYIDIVSEFDKLKNIINKNKIDTIVHFAEIKSAPYSMLNSDKSRYTVNSNVTATHNILAAIVDVSPNIHLVHMGTMGVYGYSDIFGEIPEGYLDIKVKQTNSDTKILFPTNPGSIYHMTKSLDQILFAFYNKNWGIKITDLHQGIVWGTSTKITNLDPTLANRFDYDGEYGTVLNRFIVEAASGYPISVYGTGGQTRAFIHIEDSVTCVRLAIENPPKSYEGVRIFNQVSEVKKIKDLAKLVSDHTGVGVEYISNPRKESAENELLVKNYGLRSLGFKPTLLSDSLLNDLIALAKVYSDKVNPEAIGSKAVWFNKDIPL
jgi:UDP-sulfoquinovose synthase